MPVHGIADRSAGRERLCVALDLTDRAEILRVVGELKDLVGYFKLNFAFTLFGPDLVREILAVDAKVFLDLKLHDIPNTLSGYGTAVTRLGVHIVTLHPAGGVAMMRAAVAAADETAGELGIERPKLIGVGLLTSIDEDVLADELSSPATVGDHVRRNAVLAAGAGLDGVVCSPSEIALVRPEVPDGFLFVTPGTRSPGGSGHDHRRVGTHADAVASGSSLLVVGRRILGAADRRRAVEEVLAEIDGAT